MGKMGTKGGAQDLTRPGPRPGELKRFAHSAGPGGKVKMLWLASRLQGFLAATRVSQKRVRSNTIGCYCWKLSFGASAAVAESAASAAAAVLCFPMRMWLEPFKKDRGVAPHCAS